MEKLKPSDLRPGNYIQSYKGVEKLIDVMCDSVNTESLKHAGYEYIQPVIMTGEVAKFMGFKYERPYVFEMQTTVFKFSLIITESRFVVTVSQDFLGNEKITFPSKKYLHELQNIFHSITGKEIDESHE